MAHWVSEQKIMMMMMTMMKMMMMMMKMTTTSSQTSCIDVSLCRSACEPLCVKVPMPITSVTLYICYCHIWSTEVLLCIQSNSTGSVCADCGGTAKFHRRWTDHLELSPGTVCHLHYEHQSCHRTPSHVHWRRTCSQLPSTNETFLCDSGTKHKCTYLLTYLCLCVSVHVSVWVSRWLKVCIAFIELFELLRCLSLEWRSSSETLVDNGSNTPQVRLSVIAQGHQCFRSLHRHIHADTYRETQTHTHTHKQTDRDRKTSLAIIKHLDISCIQGKVQVKVNMD